MTGKDFVRLVISIHAPRVGSDIEGVSIDRFVRISIHAPRVGSDRMCISIRSTISYFNPRSPRGERPPTGRRHSRISRHFNPRSPRGERHYQADVLVEAKKFQSTLPAWGATFGHLRLFP